MLPLMDQKLLPGMLPQVQQPVDEGEARLMEYQQELCCMVLQSRLKGVDHQLIQMQMLSHTAPTYKGYTTIKMERKTLGVEIR